MTGEIHPEQEYLQPTRVEHAVSLATGTAAHLLTPDQNLLSKLQQVWIDPELDRFEVYRDSTWEPGQYSREIYHLSTRERLVKDPHKYASLPVLLQGARQYRIGGMSVSAFCSLDEPWLQKLLEDGVRHEPLETK